MKAKQRYVAIVLVLLLCAAVSALVRTRTAAPSLDATNTNEAPSAQRAVIDQSPLETAQQFAKMATTAEEKPFADEALSLGDHEMDLAFAAAVQDAQEHPSVLSARAKEIQVHLQKADDALDSSKKRVDALTASEAKARGPKKDAS